MSADNNENATDEKTSRSIVPAKYAGRYKDGGSDELAEFIKSQCVGSEGFEFPAFFQLARVNGIAEDKVKHYEDLVESKAHGAEGRARMTIRNMLAPIARREGKLVGLDGEEHEVNLPKPPVSGAAARAKEQSASE